MENTIISFLKSQTKKEISLTDLERIFSGDTDYNSFAKQIKLLEDKHILKPVKAHRTNNKPIPLHNTYRINKSHFKDKLIDIIQTFKLKADQHINLNAYISLNEKQWEKDYIYIDIIDKYIKKNGLPSKYSSPQEMSYKLVGDEKWIDENGGKTLLTRIDIWDKLKISYNVDPLMIAINPKNINKQINNHMIVENKATFYDFLYSLEKTNFTSLVYGAGWKIVSNVSMLEKQLGLENKENKLYYFGDLDYEGISIWNRLSEERDIILAVDFYKKLLTKPPTRGKENQNENIKALKNFNNYFSREEGVKIEKLLKEKYYYPQEGLDKFEIKQIWGKIYGV